MDIRKGNDDQIALEDPVIQRLSQKYGKTPAQVRENHFLCILRKKFYSLLQMYWTKGPEKSRFDLFWIYFIDI